jgi:mitosis inhibitor protein kinase SWE1
MPSRHSYGGMGLIPDPSIRNASLVDGRIDIGASDIEDEEEDAFIADEDGFPANTAFTYNHIEGTPSPRARARGNILQKKYKPRDSGIVMSDSDSDDEFDHDMDTGSTAIPRRHSTLGFGFGASLSNSESMISTSGSSTSVGSLTSDSDALVTPLFGPGYRSGWPSVNPMVVSGMGADDSGFVDGHHRTNFLSTSAAEVDSFIFKTLTAGASSSASADMGGKKPPGTPVKRVKTAIHRLDQRPWQSAVATKISHALPGSPFAVAPPGMNTVVNQKGKKMPRKSMPASFPFPTLVTSDSEEEDLNSPSERKEMMTKASAALSKYGGIGLGKPGPGGVDPKRWLMRRNSSSAWSSGSESTSTTPTRRRVGKCHLYGKSFLELMRLCLHRCSLNNTTLVPLWSYGVWIVYEQRGSFDIELSHYITWRPFSVARNTSQVDARSPICHNDFFIDNTRILGATICVSSTSQP